MGSCCDGGGAGPAGEEDEDGGEESTAPLDDGRGALLRWEDEAKRPPRMEFNGSNGPTISFPMPVDVAVC